MSERIAFRAPNWLGDAVMSTVVVPALERAHPAATIEVLAPRGLGDVFARHPHVDGVVEFDRAGEVDALRRGGYDRVLVAPASFGAAWRAWRSGIPHRSGVAGFGRGALLTKRMASGEWSRSRHQVENDRALAALEGLALPDDAPFVALDESWVREARALWAIGEGPRVALVPGATYGPAKRWFPERYASLAAALLDRGVRVALVGGERDRDVIDRVREKSPAAVLDLAGQTRVGVLGALLGSASLVVSNDTGPMHLAAAVGTPVLALFGSTSPVWTRPFGEGHRVLEGRVPCAPCFQRTCPIGLLCFERIEAVDVLRAALEMLERNA